MTCNLWLQVINPQTETKCSTVKSIKKQGNSDLEPKRTNLN